MTFDNGNNNDNKSISTNGGIDLRNEEGFDPCMVSFSLWKSCVSLRMHPMLPPEKQTEYKKFDFETTLSTALTPQNAYILYKNIKEVIIPAIQNNEKKFVGVPVNGDGLIGVGSGRKDGSEPYLGVFKGLNPDTKIPEQMMCYQFKNNLIITAYDFESGSYTPSTESNISELELFMIILKEGIKSATNSQTHSYRNVQNFYNTQLLDTVKKIAEKNGISTGNSYGSYSRRDNVFGGGNSSNDSIPDSTVEQISQEVDNINSFLN